ncbi:MAG: DUF885 domain-containing protein [Mongoliibacter sp.]|uniref:DUF885 domain-containing protein n=1 Tax=Mongoliibacter sp. TaxID=2022438 RepID=UPI0012EFE72D|nr:DUF885 domain-containing protein [Mongoliibacter sp.]TVP44878.1 MAG: DUF885 domain-containing protein [Mongoliibacter sp.]
MKNNLYLIGLIAFISCSDNTQKNTSAPSIIELADSYYERTLETFPERAYYVDIELTEHNGITSNELAEVSRWEKYQDSLYIELSKLEVDQISEQKDRITYWLLKEELEANIGLRICKRNLWNVNHLNGWQSQWVRLVEFQPVGSAKLRSQAFERWNKLPAFVDTEIGNLKKGIEEGYTMPKEIVDLVIAQLQVLQDYSIEKSPFMSPAIRDEDPKFKEDWEALVKQTILPSLSKYQDYLVSEYLANARDKVAVTALPNGGDCYQAYIRAMTTTNKSAEELFQLGQKIVNENKAAVSKIGFEVYETDDFSEIIKRLNNDPSNNFSSAEEILAVNTKLLSKAKTESEKWFAVLPSTEVIIKPYEAHESGAGSYEPATEDKPAYYRINLKNPTQQKRSDNEILAFHEAYPGHHLQVGIAKDIKGLHPVSKFIKLASYDEGWARYGEQLSEEMGLYESKLSLIGRRAWPARGFMFDTGLHTKGWSKEQVISLVMESGYSEDIALMLYQRSIVWPAQLISYDAGGEEIKALRKMAEENLGEKFNIKQFHSKILENGSIPLSALRYNINEWVNEKKN